MTDLDGMSLQRLRRLSLNEYLKDTRHHLCIVGKFTDEKDPNKCIKRVKFDKAATAFRYRLYYRELEIDINEGTKMSTVELLFPRELLRLTEDERQSVKEIELPESLRAKLKQSKADPAEVGGTLFVELLDGLDAMLPFSHPNFDRLLTEAMIEYAFAGMRRLRQATTRGPIEELLRRPDVNQGLTVYLRTDSTDTTEGKRVRKAQLEAFARTVQKSAERKSPGFALGERGSKDGGSRIDQLVGLLESFRTGLAGEPTFGDEPDLVDDRLEDASASSEFRRAVEELVIPRRPGGIATLKWNRSQRLGEFVRELYRTFHDARNQVYSLATCEPLLTLMSVWALRKYGDEPLQMAEAVERKVDEIDIRKHAGEPAAKAVGRKVDVTEDSDEEEKRTFTSEASAKLQNDTSDELESTRELRYEDINQQSVANSAKRQALVTVKRTFAPDHKYDWEQFKGDVLQMFSELLQLRLPGMKEFLDRVDEESLAVCRAFMAYQNKLRPLSGDEAVEGKTLMEQLKSIAGGRLAEPVIKWIEEIERECPDAKGETLAEAVEKTFKKQITAQVVECTREFIHENKAEIAEFAGRAKEVQARKLEILRPGESDDDVSLAAPIGTSGVVSRDHKGTPTTEDGKLRAERYTEDVLVPAAERTKQKLRQQSKAQSAETGEEGPTRMAADKPDADGAGTSGEEPKTTPGGADSSPDLGLVESFTASLSVEQLEQIAAKDKEGEGWKKVVAYAERQAQTEQNLESEMQALIDENKLFENPNLASERGKSRALVFADIIAALGRDRSVLSLRDRSVVVHFALRLIENVGATCEYENSNGNERRRELIGDTFDKKTGRDQSGVDEIWKHNIFSVPKGKAGVRRLEQIFTQWENIAKSVCALDAQLSEFEAIEQMLKEITARGRDGFVTIVNNTVGEHLGGLNPEDLRLISSPLTEGTVPPPGIIYVTGQGTLSSEGRIDDIARLEESLFGKEDRTGNTAHSDLPPPLAWSGEGTERSTRYQAEAAHQALFSIPILVGPKVGCGPRFTQDEIEADSARLPAISIDDEGIWEAVLQLMGMAVRDRCLGKDRAARLREIAKRFGVLRPLINDKYTPELAWAEILASDGCLAQQFFGRAGTAAAFQRLKNRKLGTIWSFGSEVLDDIEALHGREALRVRLTLRKTDEDGHHESPGPEGAAAWHRHQEAPPELWMGQGDGAIPLEAVVRLVSRF